MTVESNYKIAIVMLLDWIYNVMQFFQPAYEKQNQSHLVQRMWLFPHIEQVRGNDSRNSDSFITLFALVVVGQSGNNLKVLDSIFYPFNWEGIHTPPSPHNRMWFQNGPFTPNFHSSVVFSLHVYLLGSPYEGQGSSVWWATLSVHFTTGKSEWKINYYTYHMWN